MSSPVIVEFRHCKLRVWPETQYCETVFEDGTKVPAAPGQDDSYREQARECGYGDDTWALCLQHEAFHTMLAEFEGRPWSPTLWAVAHPGGRLTREEAWDEEERVLNFQKQLNALQVITNPQLQEG